MNKCILEFNSFSKYNNYISKKSSFIIILLYHIKNTMISNLIKELNIIYNHFYYYSVKCFTANINNIKEFKKKFFINGTPFFLIFKNSKLIFTMSGYNSDIIKKIIMKNLNTKS